MNRYYFYDGYGPNLAIAGSLVALSLLFALGAWVVQGLGPYKMAKNAGIPNPWLAFIPLGQGYILGLLAQRSLYFHTGRQKPLAKINLWLPIAAVVGMIVTGVMTAILPILGVLLSLVLLASSLASVYYLYYTYYYVFKDYAPDNAVLFLILTILFSPLAFIILTLLHSNVVPVSVAGRVPYGQPKYNQPNQSGGPQGPGGYGPQGPGGYGPQGPGGYGPQDSQYHQGPEGPDQSKEQHHQGPEL